MQLDSYPFGLAALLGGLRQYLSAPSLRLIDLQDMSVPAIVPDGVGQFALRPFMVTLELDGQQNALGLVLQQAPSWAIQRQYAIYRFLGHHLPILVQGYIAADPANGWIVLEALDDLRPTSAWDLDDYREAVDNLALLHDRYWGLEEDLDTFDGLWRPLDRDYADLRGSVQEAVKKLAVQVQSEEFQRVIFRLVENLDAIAEVLRREVRTLIHGQYWAGTIARPQAGRQIVTGWQYAAIAPAILDAVIFHQQTISYLKPMLPPDAAIARYRLQLSERQGKRLWLDAEWEVAWDHALLFAFAIHTLPYLATLSSESYVAAHQHVESVWLLPVLHALEKHLPT